MKHLIAPSSVPSCVVLSFVVALAACTADSTDPYDSEEPEPLAEAEVDRPELGADGLAARMGAVAQLPGFDCSIAVVGEDVMLSWPDQGALEYEIWTSENPYFSPFMTGSGGMVVGAVSGTDFTISGANSPMAPSSSYYIIVSIDESGSQTSTTVGRHGLTLYPGYNKVPLSLQTTMSDASDLYVAMSPGVVQTHYFDPAVQDWTTWSPATMEPPFAVQDGDTPVVEMDITEPVYRAITGYVPSPAEVYPEPVLVGDNLVTLPLHFPDMLASELVAMIPGALGIGRWDPVSQEMTFGGFAEEFSELQGDITIPSGGDMHLFMLSDSVWPVSGTGPTLPPSGGPVSDEPSDCCTASSLAGCTDPGIESCVCEGDSFCCNVAWDGICVSEVTSFSCGTC